MSGIKHPVHINMSCTSYLCMDTVHLAEGMVHWGGSSCGHRSDKRTFISVGHLVRTGTRPANIHDVETRLNTAGRGDTRGRVQAACREVKNTTCRRILGTVDSLVAVGKIKQVLHCHKGVVESLGWGNPLLRVNQQHLLQQAHKLQTVCLLCQQVTTFQIHHQVHLESKHLLKPLLTVLKNRIYK